jgi:L-threonylcarbamoyladenylate synthase
MARRLPDMPRIEWPEGRPAPPPSTLAVLDRAAEVIRGGGLVAIPTETVYGLAADALDADAVEAIFRAKGRPASNPLIVHVADAVMARSLVASWPEPAARIAEALWPGPVTVVVPRSRVVPDIVTAGGSTVAVRCPGLPLTRLLIERAGRPLAAPSANRSEAVSPTTAHHVLEGLGHRVDLILDAGPCRHGIESTVVDCTTVPPRILRPGPLSRSCIEAAVGGPVVDGSHAVEEGTTRSPGTGARHYAPRTRLEAPDDPPARVADLLRQGLRVGWLTFRAADPGTRALAAANDRLIVVPADPDPDGFARALFATLHALDRRALDRLVVDLPPSDEPWFAVRDRIRRAARETDD